MPKRTYQISPRKPAWPKALKAYVIGQLAVWAKYSEIYTDITAEDFQERTQIPCLDPDIFSYSNFVTRCKKIPKETITKAHLEWKNSFDNIRWSHQKARVEAMSTLADKIMNSLTGKVDKDSNTLVDFLASKETLTTLVTELRQLMEGIRREMSGDADRAALGAGATRVLIGNPLSISVDMQDVQELLMLLRMEHGGLHHFDYFSLSLKELAQLRDKVDETIIDKQSEIQEIECEIIEEGKEKLDNTTNENETV